MRRSAVTLSSVLSAMVFVAATPMADVSAAQTRRAMRADSPTLVPGDIWTVRYSGGARGTRKFLREEAGVLVFEVSQTWKDGGSTQSFLHLTRDLSIVRLLDADGTEQQRFDPHSLGLQFPLASGKEWQERCERYDRGKPVGTFVGAYRVVGIERVGGPAGTFQTFRVEGQAYEVQAPTRLWRFTHWYAPEARMEVKLQAVEPEGSGMLVELVEFRPAGHSPPPAPSSGRGSGEGAEAFLGVWEGHWKETILATRLTVERIEGNTAWVIYWRGASRYPAFQRPSQQRAEGRLLGQRTLKLEIWDDAGQRWADVIYRLNPDGTLTGEWSSGGFRAHATLQREP